VSVREDIDSMESFVIQRRRSKLEWTADVDGREPGSL
jgi:hypothetical protein